MTVAGISINKVGGLDGMYFAYRDDWTTSGREYTECQKPSKDTEMHSLKK
jgi:hypothetical protein